MENKNEILQGLNYALHLQGFEKSVRQVMRKHDGVLDKDSQAGVLLEIEEELRQQYEEETND